MKVRSARPEDCHSIDDLMGRLIDEIYARESAEVRRVLKANFTKEAFQELCRDEHSVLYVVEDDGRIVAFLYGWYFRYVLTIYWIYSLKEFRGKGVVKALLGHAETELKAQGCWKFEMYAYAENNRFLDFSAKLGFSKGVLIEKSMFGFKIQNIYKVIAEPGPDKRETKVKIIGEAGQGVKLLSYTLAQVLAQLGHEVSLNLAYDAAVRGGTISADLIYSSRPIENPVIDEADVLIKFTRTREWFPAKALVIDESMCREEALECSIQTSQGTMFGFEDVAVQLFGSKIYINMIALGRILRYIGVNILLLNIKDLLPARAIEKNLEAIRYGFSYRDDV
ncbi:MAG TPA: GNAT family N-acetyltransferase [Acidobacteriota bacterium]|nr:GNAT family N-acetyltransferase [Acidobacteriota bacterium]